MEEKLDYTSLESEIFMDSPSTVLNRFTLDQNNQLVVSEKNNAAKCQWHCM